MTVKRLRKIQGIACLNCLEKTLAHVLVTIEQNSQNTKNKECKRTKERRFYLPGIYLEWDLCDG